MKKIVINKKKQVTHDYAVIQLSVQLLSTFHGLNKYITTSYVVIKRTTRLM